MEKLVSFLGTVSLQSVIFMLLALVCVGGIVYWILIAVAKNKEEKKKKSPFTLAVEHFDKLFRIVKIEEDKSIAFLHFDPTREYSSGKAGAWFSLENVQDNLKFEGSIIKVIKGPDEELMIVPIQSNRLPAEKEFQGLEKAKVPEAEVKALEVQEKIEMATT